MKHTIPPAIRVFISSTFSDMLNERKYFNTVLDPELSRLCASRGVSFFAVDLRWGITEEQANNGEVIPMCLREIDHCRPFFIGIIGNRYGSTLAEIGLKDDGQFPWLAGRENKSATELEMLYGVLECEEGKECPDCLFMLRSDELSAENFKGTESEEKRRCVEELRKRVTEQEDIPCEDYNSLEEFGEKIIRQFTIWLDENFPSTDSAAKARHDFYNGELMRNYVRIKQAEDFVDRFCHYGNVPLLICGSGPRGKTSLLTHWEPSYKGIDISVFSEPVNEMISPRSKNRSCRKILINVESDPAYVYWPNVAYEILDALECEKHDRPGFYETEEELEEFRRFFVKQVENKFTENLIYIVINDIDKMKGAKAEYLSWLPSSLPDNLNIICSAGDPEIASTAELLGWGVQELQVLSEELQSKFLQEYLTMFGKNLNAEQEFFILGGGVTDFAGNIKLIVRFLNQYAAFESLSNISMDISECITSEELLNYIWNYACRGLNDNIKKSAEAAAYFLASSSIAPTEDELFTTVNSYITTTPLEWNTVRVLLDLFGVNKNDTWSISDSTIRSFFENMPIDHEKAESILYSHYKSLLRSKDDSIPNDRKTVLLTKAVICHMLKAKNYTDIGRFLCDPKNMRTLSGLEWDYVRSAWLKVLLYSDENVESMLRALPGKEAVSLLLDLGFEKAANEEAKRRKVSAVSELKFKYSKYMSPEVSEFYQTVCRVFDTQVYPLVCEMINNFLSGKKNKLNSYEKFQLYYELADAYTLMQNHSGGLEIAAKAYKEALRSMSDYNIMLTIMQQGFCYRSMNQLSKAKERFGFVMQRAMSIGDTFNYLDATTNYTNCFSQTYQEDLALVEICEKTWRKLGNVTGVISSIVAKGTILRELRALEDSSAELKRAYTVFNDHREEFRSRLDLEITILIHLGNLNLEMGNLREAEQYYLKAHSAGINTPVETMLGIVFQNLLLIYKKNDNITKSAYCHELFADLLYKYNDKENALREVNLAYSDYLEAGLKGEYTRLSAKWEELRSKDYELDFILDDMSEDEMIDDISDSPNIDDPYIPENVSDEWKKQLLLARSSGDDYELIDVLIRGVSLYKDIQPQKARDMLQEAMDLLDEYGEDEKVARYKLEYADLYLDLPETNIDYKAFFYDYSDEDREFFDIWKKMRLCNSNDPMYEQLLRELVQSEEAEDIRFHCILDQADTILHSYNNYVPGVMKMIKGSSIEWAFIEKTVSLYKERLKALIEKMKNAPMDPTVQQHLEYFMYAVEALIEVGNEIPSTTILRGEIAGNIGLVLRKRGEYDLALKYHNIAIDAYSREVMIEDSYIEQLNIALVYSSMKDWSRAKQILSDALKDYTDHHDNEYPRIKAALCGNLASVAIESLEDDVPDDETDQLILECFKTEEAYYREACEPYDLTVSLVNQLIYLRRNARMHMEEIQSIYQEAAKLARDYSMSQFIEFLQEYAKSFS